MNQSEKRLFLIRSLLKEKPEYRDLRIPAEPESQRQLLRGLMNIRAPQRIDAEFLKIQDAYLQGENATKGVTDVADLVPVQPGLYLWQGDITTLKCDAIVNAANSGMTGCYIPNHRCIDNAIHTYAGVELRLACAETFDNEEITKSMVTAQGYMIDPDGTLVPPEMPKMTVPTELLPVCPHCGTPLTMNLRSDDKFVEDEGWHRAAARYENFLRTHAGQKILFLELGVGYNTPVIIKYPFWQMTAKNPNAIYACINQGQAACPQEIERQSIYIDADIGYIVSLAGSVG